MRSKIDYKPLAQDALSIMTRVQQLAQEFAKYEMTPEVQAEMQDILELSNTKDPLYHSQDHKENFAELMESFVHIDDDLTEVEELIEEISEQREQVFYEMFELTQETLEKFARYYSEDKEDYVEFEDEVEE